MSVDRTPSEWRSFSETKGASAPTKHYNKEEKDMPYDEEYDSYDDECPKDETGTDLDLITEFNVGVHLTEVKDGVLTVEPYYIY